MADEGTEVPFSSRRLTRRQEETSIDLLISVAAAEVYESRFVPAFFAEWALHLVDFAGTEPSKDREARSFEAGNIPEVWPHATPRP